MPGLPLDGNGSFAAVDTPPMVMAQGPPEAGGSQPMVPATPNMDAVAAMFANKNPDPGAGPEPGVAPENPMAKALTSLQPTQPQTPKDPEELNLIQKMQELNKNRQQLQQQLQAELQPDALRRYLPNGGKQKASDFLADALFNTAQLNLRNPTYGSLKGHDYTPIQQQRMDQALKLHQSAIQNLTQQEAINRDESTTAMAQLNQTRLQKQQADKVAQYEATNQIKMQDLLRKQAVDASLAKYRAINSEASVGLKGAQQARTEALTDMLDKFGGNKADFLNYYVKNHSEDPTFNADYTKLYTDLHPQKPSNEWTPGKAIQQIMLEDLVSIRRPEGLAEFTNTTLGGSGKFGEPVGGSKEYIDLSDVNDAKQKTVLAGVARKQGIPVINDKGVAKAIKEIDESKLNTAAVWDSISESLPKDANGRLMGGALAIKLGQLFQSGDGKAAAAYGAWRTQAIKTRQALAGGMGSGLRINGAEIKLSLENDIPSVTDTVEVAAQKLSHIFTLLNNHQAMNLVHDRSSMNPVTNPQKEQKIGTSKPAAIAPPNPTKETPKSRTIGGLPVGNE